jgi:hypothetical protein
VIAGIRLRQRLKHPNPLLKDGGFFVEAETPATIPLSRRFEKEICQ